MDNFFTKIYSKTKLAYLVIGLLIIIGGYFLSTNSLVNEISKAVNLSTKPQFFMQHFTQKITNVDGEVSSQISGVSLEYFPKQKYAIITRPRVNLNINDSWLITANIAKKYSDIWQLSGNVVVRQQQKQFTTSAITINPQTAIVTSDQPVLFNDNKIKTSGLGVNFFGKTGIIHILANTVTTYGQ